MELISVKYRHLLSTILTAAGEEIPVTADSVYHEAKIAIRPSIDMVLTENLESGSAFTGIENIRALYDYARQGKKCLLLVEHYSNFDLPLVSYLLRQAGCAEIADNIIAVAGIKLSQAQRVVGAFSEAYSRLVIYPSRAINELLEKIPDPEQRAAEIVKANAINTAAMKELARLRASGKLILVFPAGTRCRPWDPESKRGVREIDSYLRSFDYMSLVSINGNILRLNPNGEMLEDIVCRDKVIIHAASPVLCDNFRERIKRSLPNDSPLDKKQAVVDAIMAELDTMHAAVEATRV